MKKSIESIVIQNRPVGPVYDMIIEPQGFFGENPRPGQFLEIYVGKGEHLLPRPISICETLPGNRIRLIYQVAGQGTAHFAVLSAGAVLTVIGPLGNGYTPAEADCHWLVGGGVGIPPLLFLAKQLREQTKGRVTAVLGYRSEPFLAADFKPFCDEVHIATDDGSYGFKGNAVALMQNTAQERGLTTNAAVYACGPRVMLRALCQWTEVVSLPLQVSMEERMACGIGSCVGCAVSVKQDNGTVYKRVCKDGPVFDGRRLVL